MCCETIIFPVVLLFAYQTQTQTQTHKLKPPTDTVRPVISQVQLSSNNSINSSRATVGDKLTVTFTASEALSSLPTVLIDSRVANLTSNSATTFIATITTTLADVQGFVSVLIVGGTDRAGNEQLNVSSTADNSFVILGK